MSLRDRLKEKSQSRYKEVEVPGIGKLMVQTLTGGDRHEVELSMFNRKTGKLDEQALGSTKWRLLARAIIDPETKERVYADSEWEEIKALESWITDPLQKAFASLSGDDEVNPEDLVGNSD